MYQALIIICILLIIFGIIFTISQMNQTRFTIVIYIFLIIICFICTILFTNIIWNDTVTISMTTEELSGLLFHLKNDNLYNKFMNSNTSTTKTRSFTDKWNVVYDKNTKEYIDCTPTFSQTLKK